jgi:hypothetical protein
MRTFSRRFLAVAALVFSLGLTTGCGDSETGGQKPANTDLKLKPLPNPGSPGGGGETTKQKGAPGGGPITQ